MLKRKILFVLKDLVQQDTKRSFFGKKPIVKNKIRAYKYTILSIELIS